MDLPHYYCVCWMEEMHSLVSKMTTVIDAACVMFLEWCTYYNMVHVINYTMYNVVIVHVIPTLFKVTSAWYTFCSIYTS